MHIKRSCKNETGGRCERPCWMESMIIIGSGKQKLRLICVSGSDGVIHWSSRLIAAMADASYKQSLFHIERYQLKVMSKSHEIINTYNDLIEKSEDKLTLRHQANEKIAEMVKQETADTLNKVLFELSSNMKNAYSRSDA